MIVEITSLAPTVARRSPAIPAQAPPASAPSTSASTMCRMAGSPSIEEPAYTAMIAPTAY